jgi:hypothetical protein
MARTDHARLTRLSLEGLEPMKYADLKADNERLRTQLADLVNAVAALRMEYFTKPAGTVSSDVIFAEKLAAILDQQRAIR